MTLTRKQLQDIRTNIDTIEPTRELIIQIMETLDELAVAYVDLYKQQEKDIIKRVMKEGGKWN